MIGFIVSLSLSLSFTQNHQISRSQGYFKGLANSQHTPQVKKYLTMVPGPSGRPAHVLLDMTKAITRFYYQIKSQHKKLFL